MFVRYVVNCYLKRKHASYFASLDTSLQIIVDHVCLLCTYLESNRTHYFMNTSFELRSSDVTSVLSIYPSMFLHLYIVFTWKTISTPKCPTCRFLGSSLFDMWCLIERNDPEQVRVRQVFSRALVGVVLDTLFSSSSGRESGRVSFLAFYGEARKVSTSILKANPKNIYKHIQCDFVMILRRLTVAYDFNSRIHRDWSWEALSRVQKRYRSASDMDDEDLIHYGERQKKEQQSLIVCRFSRRLMSCSFSLLYEDERKQNRERHHRLFSNMCFSCSLLNQYC